MYLVVSVLLLSIATAVSTQSYTHPACPNDGFKYIYMTAKNEWVGIGWAWTTLGYRLNNITLQVEFATANLTDTSNLGSLKILNFYEVKNPNDKKEWTMVYEVKFPIQDPLPNVTKIVLNEDVICNDPQYAFTPEKPLLVKLRLRYNDLLEEQTFSTELVTKSNSTEEEIYHGGDNAVSTNNDTTHLFPVSYLHPKCPDSGLKFVHTSNKQDGWIGLGWAWTQEEFRFNNLVIEVELASVMPDNTTDLGSLKVLNFYPVRNPKNETKWNIVYEIKFPMQVPLPDVTKITWNDQTLCYDPNKVFTAEKPILIRMRVKYNNILEEQMFTTEFVTKSNETTTFPTIHVKGGVSPAKDPNYYIPERFDLPACTDAGIKFVYLDQETGWVALGWAWTSETYRFHDLTLEVDFATAMIPNTTDLGSLKVLTFYRVKNDPDYKREWNVAYEIRFPTQDPLPDITKVVWNDQTLCHDPDSIYTPQKPFLVKMRLRYNDYLEEQTFTSELITAPYYTTTTTTTTTISPKEQDLTDIKSKKLNVDPVSDRKEDELNEITTSLESSTKQNV